LLTVALIVMISPDKSVRRTALILCGYLVFALVLAPTLIAQPLMRLEGLERLYFDHVGGKENHSHLPAFLVELLPAKIQAATFSSRKISRELQDGELELQADVRDFHLSLGQPKGDLWLRQVSVGVGAARITQLWWALYDQGQRSDVWYFTANPERTDSKALSNYEIEAASASAEGVKLQVCGSMFRPGGAWWVTGKTFFFSRQNETLRFSRVTNDFGFFQDYEVPDKSDSLDVTTEKEVDGRFQILSYDKIQEPILRACGFRNPLADDTWEFNWARMERTARCFASKMKARESYRGLDQPSFIERGGSSPERGPRALLSDFTGVQQLRARPLHKTKAAQTWAAGIRRSLSTTNFPYFTVRL